VLIIILKMFGLSNLLKIWLKFFTGADINNYKEPVSINGTN